MSTIDLNYFYFNDSLSLALLVTVFIEITVFLCVYILLNLENFSSSNIVAGYVFDVLVFLITA